MVSLRGVPVKTLANKVLNLTGRYVPRRLTPESLIVLSHLVGKL
jgi:hypothetical protein